MKRVNRHIIEEYTYETKAEREAHAMVMESEGWECDGQVKRLKPDVSILDAKDEDREWFARFQKFE